MMILIVLIGMNHVSIIKIVNAVVVLIGIRSLVLFVLWYKEKLCSVILI